MANEVFLSYGTVKDLDGTVSAFQVALENELKQRTNDDCYHLSR